MFRRVYRPSHGENRMRNEGDVAGARAYYFGRRSQNLHFLLAHRYEWMNHFIDAGHVGIEVGCGSGLSKEFIRAKEYRLTDLADHDWIDVKNADALNMPFAADSFDFVTSSNMIHHVPHPLVFFKEMNRILKPGGVLLIQEINASCCMRFLLRLMRHEGYSFTANVFDEREVCTDPDDLWSANCAIPNLLFDDRERFERHVPCFKMVHHRFREFLCFINSGGVIAKTKYVPLPSPVLRLLKVVDDLVTGLLPQTFALQRQVVLRKTGGWAEATHAPAGDARELCAV